MKWALALLVLLPSMALAEDEVVAEIGTATKITRAELEKQAEASDLYKALVRGGSKDEVRRFLETELDRMVEERILLLECDRKGIEGPSSQARIDRLAADVTSDVVVTREDAQRFYDEHESDFELPARTRLWVLETMDRSKADEARGQLQGKRDAWPAVAEKLDMKLREIADASLEEELGPRAVEIAALKKNGVLTIITATGYATVALVDRLPARTQPLEEIEDALRARLKETTVRKRCLDYLEALKKTTPHRAKLPD
jgi:hypothetical protein